MTQPRDRTPQPAGESPALEPTLHAGLLRSIERALIAQGVDHRAVLATVGLTPSDLEAPDARVSHRRAVEVFETAARSSGDPAFGFVTAEHADLADIGLMGQLLVTAPSVGAAIERATRYGKLLHDAVESWHERDGERFLWHTRMRAEPISLVATESLIGGAIARLRYRLGPEWAPLEVWLEHPEPAHHAVYQRFFRCPVRFGASSTCVVLDARVLELKNAVDGAVAELIERRAEAALARLRGRKSFASEARQVLAHALSTGELGADAVARALGVSRATLTRRLSAEAATLSGLLDSLRHELAVEYLRDPSVSVEELARRLAFSDARALRRAFTRWTGMTPAAFRKQR